jgi:hypothetical protein
MKRRLIGSVTVAILFILACVSFGGAVILVRLDALTTKADVQLEEDSSIGGWSIFLGYPINRWLIERVGDTDSLALREAYALLAQYKVQDAADILRKLADSEDKKLASISFTLSGKILVFQALQNNDEKLFEAARQLFAKAIVLDPSNEDAKRNLELLSVSRNAQGGSQADQENQNGDLPLDVLPGSGGGTPNDYSNY